MRVSCPRWFANGGRPLEGRGLRSLLVALNIAGLLLVGFGVARAYVPAYCGNESPHLVSMDIHTPLGYHVELTAHPSWTRDGISYFHPVRWAQTGHALLDAGRAADARIVADDLWAHADPGGWFPYVMDSLATGNEPVWYSGMAQGQALGLFARVGELHRAATVYQTLLPGSPVVDENDWIIEYPGYPPVLNGAIFAVLGLYDYWQATDDPAVQQRTENAISVIAHDVNRFRNPGSVSSYEMSDRNRYPDYHAIHVTQLHLLSQMTGMRCLEQAAEDFDADAYE